MRTTKRTNAIEAVDERDISGPVNWLKQQRASAVVGALKKRRFNAQYVADRSKALSAVLALIPKGASVFRADSVTLDQIEIIPALRARKKNKVMWPQEKDGHGHPLYGEYTLNRDRIAKIQREAFSADVYLTGVNAITLDGKLVSTDGAGNRVAPMMFGPTKVVVVVGVNKIVRDLDAAFERIREFCAPVNARRHFEMHHRSWYRKLPCLTTGICVDCDHARRICNFTGIFEGAGARFKGRINVILVGEELGM